MRISTPPVWLQGVLLAVVVTAVLSPALTMEFIWDDHWQIVDSEEVRDLGRVPALFGVNVRQGAGIEGGYAAENLDTYRPLFLTVLAVQYALAGGARPTAFHLLSVLWHVLVAVLLWVVARRWLRSDGLAALATLLFVFNPVTAEAWLFVSAVCDPIAVSFLLGAILLLDATPGRSAPRGWLMAAAAGLSLLAGLMTKEVIVMALPALSLWLVFGRGVRARLLAPAWLAVGSYIALRSAVLGGLKATGESGAQRLDAVHHAPLLMVDGLRAVLSLSPVGYRDVSYEYEIVSWPWAVAAAALLAALAIALWLGRSRAPLAPLALAVHVSMLAPVAMLSTVYQWGGFGRYLYLSWLFVSLGVVQLLAVLAGSLGRRRVVRVAGVVALVTYMALQQLGLHLARGAYRTDEDLRLGAVEAAPHAATGYLMLAQEALNDGDLAASASLYDEAFARDPDLGYREARQNYGTALVYTGRPAEGLEMFLRTEEMSGRGPKSSFGVGLALHALGRDEEASERVEWALRLAPQDEDLNWLRDQIAGQPPGAR